MKTIFEERTTCRISGEPLVPLFSLGNLYMTDFLARDEYPDPSKKLPLDLMLAPKSGLVQLGHTFDPDQLYRRYWYHSGTNEMMDIELKSIVDSTCDLVDFNDGDVWLDIGCNDGTLFKHIPRGVVPIGFDPAEIARDRSKNIARMYDAQIVNNYFNVPEYNLASGYKKAKVVTAISMFYDLDSPGDFLDSIYEILDDNGVFVIQMNYLPLMLRLLAFDNISHEHLCYYTLTVMRKLLLEHNFDIADCVINHMNGGSFRLYIKKYGTRIGSRLFNYVADYRIDSLLISESSLYLDDIHTYTYFYDRVLLLKESLVSFISEEKKAGRDTWVYGASSRGNTLLQFCGLDDSLIYGAADRHHSKYLRRTIGTNIPIYSEGYMREMNPNYLLVLPWGFIDSFVKREARYLNNGGRFIVPCPEFEIIGG